jgi:hypothetical protein
MLSLHFAFWVFFVVLGIEPKASGMLSKDELYP